MHTPPVVGTKALLFGACASDAHERCPERTTIGATILVCSCTVCHQGIDPAEWDAAYGPAWGVDVDEGE